MPESPFLMPHALCQVLGSVMSLSFPRSLSVSPKRGEVRCLDEDCTQVSRGVPVFFQSISPEISQVAAHMKFQAL